MGRGRRRWPGAALVPVARGPRPAARGETVMDVHAAAPARVRQLSRGGGRKNDTIDAAAAATVAAVQGDARPVGSEAHTTVLALLDERRGNLAQSRVRAANQLHALLCDLPPGGVPTQLSAAQTAGLLRRIRPAGPAESVRKQLARDLVAELLTLDAQLAANAEQLRQAVGVAQHPDGHSWDRPGAGRPTARSHRATHPVPHGSRLRGLLRDRTGGDRERGQGPPSPLPRW